MQTVEERQTRAERKLYEDAQLSVSRTRIRARDAIYPVRAISSVRLVARGKNYAWAVVSIVIAFCALVQSFAIGASSHAPGSLSNQDVSWIVTVLALLGAIVFATRAKARFAVELRACGGERHVVKCDEDVARALFAALDLAVVSC